MKDVSSHTVATRATRTASLVVLLLVVAVSGAVGQSLWSLSDGRSAASLEIMSSSFNTGPEQSLSSYVVVFSKVWVPSPRVRLVGDLPIGYAKASRTCYGSYCYRYGYGSETCTALGNPYLGAHFLFGDNPLSYLEVGGRLPVAKERLYRFEELGMIADTDRLGWFASNLLIGHIALNWGEKIDRGFVWAMRVGPMLAMTKGCCGGGAALNLQYGTRVGLDNGKVHVGAGVSGILGLTASGADLSERTVHTFACRFGVRTSVVEPSLMLRVPLDQDAAWGGLCRYTVSIGLTVPIETKG